MTPNPPPRRSKEDDWRKEAFAQKHRADVAEVECRELREALGLIVASSTEPFAREVADEALAATSEEPG